IASERIFFRSAGRRSGGRPSREDAAAFFLRRNKQAILGRLKFSISIALKPAVLALCLLAFLAIAETYFFVSPLRIYRTALLRIDTSEDDCRSGTTVQTWRFEPWNIVGVYIQVNGTLFPIVRTGPTGLISSLHKNYAPIFDSATNAFCSA